MKRRKFLGLAALGSLAVPAAAMGNSTRITDVLVKANTLVNTTIRELADGFDRPIIIVTQDLRARMVQEGCSKDGSLLYEYDLDEQGRVVFDCAGQAIWTTVRRRLIRDSTGSTVFIAEIPKFSNTFRLEDCRYAEGLPRLFGEAHVCNGYLQFEEYDPAVGFQGAFEVFYSAKGVRYNTTEHTSTI